MFIICHLIHTPAPAAAKLSNLACITSTFARGSSSVRDVIMLLLPKKLYEGIAAGFRR